MKYLTIEATVVVAIFAAIGLGNAVVDLITLTGVATIVFGIVRHYRNKVSSRDDVIKDREARIRLLEYDLGRAEGSKSRAEAEMSRYREQLGRLDGDVVPLMRKVNNGES